MFELTNSQREYLGLEPIEPTWERVILKGDPYRPETILYFDANVIKRHILSTEEEYKELQYEELTKDREILLPKTSKGKEKKLTASVLESRTAIGVYFTVNISGQIRIGNYNSQTTFYSSYWESFDKQQAKPIREWVEEFILESSDSHLDEINQFKHLKRKNVKFKSGDFFSFKISRTEYGFGRVLLKIEDLKKKDLIPRIHGLNFIMTKPVLIKIYAYVSESNNIDIAKLKTVTTLPSDYIMDNLLLYGEYEIIGNRALEESDLDFPMSYGRILDYSKRNVFFQWGLIHKELPLSSFDKYLIAENPFMPENSPSRKKMQPYGYYSVGFSSKYNTNDIKQTIKNGKFDFDKSAHYASFFDLRNPRNGEIKLELMRVFGLDAKRSYRENCQLSNTPQVFY